MLLNSSTPDGASPPASAIFSIIDDDIDSALGVAPSDRDALVNSSNRLSGPFLLVRSLLHVCPSCHIVWLDCITPALPPVTFFPSLMPLFYTF